MKLGVVTPVVTRLPRAHATWEETAGIDEIARVAVEAERLGYHHLTCSEHVALPAAVADTRGATYWDPLPTFGYIAARTTTIRLATHVLVLGYHHPLAIAKRYGTLDRASGGRLVLGVGVGSLREEFDLLGAEFEGRGARADDAIRALRASLSEYEPAYRGEHYAYDGFVVDPCAVQPGVPIWIGGRTARSLRRAIELADGWAPFGLSRTDLADMIARARDTPRHGRHAHKQPMHRRSSSCCRTSIRSIRRPSPTGSASPPNVWPTRARRRSTCESCTTRSSTTSSSWPRCAS